MGYGGPKYEKRPGCETNNRLRSCHHKASQPVKENSVGTEKMGYGNPKYEKQPVVD
ncbi:hypothetical protein Sjap_000865 [Stephania japonica]|uniref:Uncharacterized protein n=1 Tax=Stephania japonica TaxID=461633 RepID=A0AAP0PSU1_9MAGN